MKYNHRDRIEQIIKRELLKEAMSHIRDVKFASLEKEGMATYRGQKDLGALVNLQTFKPDASPRIQSIADNILKTFESFLRSRLKPSQGGDNRLYMKVPAIREDTQPEATFVIPNIPVENMGDNFNPLVNGKDRKIRSQNVKSFSDITESADGLDPNQPNPKTDLKGLVPQGCIYYRYGYVRTVLPDANSSPDEYQRAVSNIELLQTSLEKNGVRFDCKQFISDMEQLGIALMPGFNYAQIASKDVIRFIEQEYQEVAARLSSGQPQPGDNAIVALKKYIDDFKNEQTSSAERGRGQPPAAFGIGNRKEYFLYDGTPPTGSDYISPQIKMLTNERALGRMIEAKIMCGYSLNYKGLTDTIYRYIYATAKNQERSSIQVGNKRVSKKVSIHTLRVLARQWDRQIKHMGKVYQSIEDSVTKKEPKFASVSAHGLEWEGRKKFQRLVTDDKSMSWNYLHFQMLLQNITKPAPQLRRYPIHIKVNKYQFFDPSSSLSFYCDGVSQRTGVKSQLGKRAAILPPFIETRYSRNQMDDNARDESFEEFEEPGKQTKGMPQLSYQGINLGLAHLVYNGPGVTKLLQKYGPIAEQIVPVLRGEKFRSMFADQNDPANIVLKSYPTAYLGSESLSRMLHEISSSQDPVSELQTRLSQVKKSGKQKEQEGIADSAFDPQNWELLKLYAYPLAKLMEIVYGLIHVANETQLRYINPETGAVTPFKMYGQSYGTSSGMGQGGELLLSVRYAYKTKLENYTGGNEQATNIVKDEYNKKPHDNRIPATMSPASETQWPQKGTIDEGLVDNSGTVIGQPKVNCQFVSNFEYFLGQSSTSPTKSGQASMFNTVMVSHDWQDCLAQLRRLYSSGKLYIDEANGDFIWDINADLDHLENAIHAAINHAKDRVANISLTIVDRDQNVEKVEPGEVPDGTLTDQPAEEIAEQAEQKPIVESVPTDEIQSPAKPPRKQKRVLQPADARTIPNAFPTLESVLNSPDVNAARILSVMPKQINEQLEDRIVRALQSRYGKNVIQMRYSILFEDDQLAANPTKLVKALLKQLADDDREQEMDQRIVPQTLPPERQVTLTPPTDPQNPPPEQVNKPSDGKSMWKHENPTTGKSVLHSSIQERLMILANTFDSRGYRQVADNIDLLLEKLSRTEN